jgi:hypothetical protein
MQYPDSSHRLPWLGLARNSASFYRIEARVARADCQSSTDRMADRPDTRSRSSTLWEADMSAFATILSIWFMVATCAILFIRGASPRVATRLERSKVTVEAHPYRRR